MKHRSLSKKRLLKYAIENKEANEEECRFLCRLANMKAVILDGEHNILSVVNKDRPDVIPPLTMNSQRFITLTHAKAKTYIDLLLFFCRSDIKVELIHGKRSPMQLQKMVESANYLALHA